MRPHTAIYVSSYADRLRSVGLLSKDEVAHARGALAQLGTQFTRFTRTKVQNSDAEGGAVASHPTASARCTPASLVERATSAAAAAAAGLLRPH